MSWRTRGGVVALATIQLALAGDTLPQLRARVVQPVTDETQAAFERLAKSGTRSGSATSRSFDPFQEESRRAPSSETPNGATGTAAAGPTKETAPSSPRGGGSSEPRGAPSEGVAGLLPVPRDVKVTLERRLLRFAWTLARDPGVLNIEIQRSGGAKDFEKYIVIRADSQEFEARITPDDVPGARYRLRSLGANSFSEFSDVVELADPANPNLEVDRTGLVFLFTFDGPLGPVVAESAVEDSSGNSHHGITKNPNGSGMRIDPGKHGTALFLDGVDDLVRVEQEEAARLTAGSMMIWAKAQPHMTTGPYWIFAREGWWLLALYQGNLWSWDWGLAYRGLTATAPMTDGKWHHLAMTWNSRATGETLLYLDGTRVLQTEIAVNETAVPVSIGARADGYYPFAGWVDEASLWGRILSPGEISQEAKRRD